MIERLEGWIDAIIVNLPNILLAIIVFLAVYIVSKWVRRLLCRLLQRTRLQESMINLIAKIASVVIILVGLFLVLGIMNLSKTLNAILAGAGVAGLAVGLALQGALANTYSGIILSYVKNIKFGDWIESNGYEGEITNIDLRVVTIKQIDNNLVYIPNRMVVENPIKNFSITDQSKVIVECGVAYGSDLRAVRELVLETISSNFDSLSSKRDMIFLYKQFGDSSIDFELRFWIDATSALEVAKAKTEAMILIKEAFDSEGITIPFPIRTLDIPEEIVVKTNS